MEQQKSHIEFLIRAIDYFVSNPQEEFYNDIPKKIVNHLVYQEIKIFDPLLRYKDFKKSTLDERRKKLRFYLSKTVTATVPQNLELLLEQAEKHEKDLATQKTKRQVYQRNYKWGASFAKKEQTVALEMQSLDILTEDATELAAIPVAASTNKRGILLNQARKNPEELSKKIVDALVIEVEPESEEQVKEIENIVKDYVDRMSRIAESEPLLLINSPEIKKSFDEKRVLEIDDVLIKVPLPTKEDLSNIDRLLQVANSTPGRLQVNLAEETGSEEFAESFTDNIISPNLFLPTLPVIKTSIGMEAAARAQNVIGQIAGESITEAIFGQVPPLSDVSVPTTTAFQSFMLPIATSVAAKEMAKTEPEKAVANDLFLVRGVNSKSKDLELVASRLNLTNEQLYLVKEQLNTLEKAFPGYQPNINQLLSIVTGQIAQFRVTEEVAATGDVYQDYVQLFPPTTGVRGFFLRSFQQTFGGLAKRYVDGAIKNGLSKAGAALAKKVVSSAIGKALTGAAAAVSNVFPFLGPILAWVGSKILSRIAPLIKKYIVPIFAALAGLAGFTVFGPVGAIVGGIGGAVAAGGVAGGSFSAGLATVGGGITAIGGAFTAAIAIPLMIAVVGIPVSVALILFIINSGAYVVPSSGVIAVTGPGCPSGWPVDDPIVIVQGPQGAFSHRGYEAIDIDKTTGTTVRATHSGIALVLDFDGKSYGLNVRVTSTCNGKQFQTVYGHLNTVAVTDKQTVSAGDIIGTVDTTGNSTGPHLHYEFRPGWGTDDGPLGVNQEPLLMGPPYIPRAVR